MRLQRLERRPKRMSDEAAEAARIARSEDIRRRIEAVVQEMLSERGWPESVRRVAEDEFCLHAANVCAPSSYGAKTWAGRTAKERKRGAISSLQVLLGHHAPFRNRRGYLQDAKGNQWWVLDCWEHALREWEGDHQLRLV